MSENYSRSLLRISVAQICQNLGWNSAQSSSLEVLTDVLERYLLQLGGVCHRYSEQFGRSEPNLDDLALAFKHMCIDVSELEDYVRNVDPVPFAHDVVAFPAQKLSSLDFPNPQSREILMHREEHVDSHLPYMFPHLKDEIPTESETKPGFNSIQGLEEAPQTEDATVNGEGGAEKRPGQNGTLEVPNKRQRLGNSSLPEEAGQSQYEMTCVFMNPNGILTTRPGCQGKLPEARLPPPNPRNLSENNKENKLKGSGNGPKITISGGGIGAEGVVKSGKSSKKSSHKKGLHLHESAAKAALDMTSKEIGKKSASSKAAAKFIKKLKTNKKSAKIFGKKGKETKSQENLEGVGNSDRGEGQKGKSGKRKKKEKKSAAIIDSDEELRNLSSPSSPTVPPSPDRRPRHGGEESSKRKQKSSTVDAIDDSINAVLKEEESSKVKKKKKKDNKSVEVSSSKQEPEVKPSPKKKGRPPGSKKDKKPEPPPPPPPIDIKPFVSDKYSSEELQVYEFNDSPPDASSLKSRQPSAPCESSPPRPKASKTARVVEQEELFAPEFKIETIKPLKLDLHKEKEKNKSKEDKKERSEDQDKHKVKNEKEDKHREKKKEDDKEKMKDKDVKKDKKDKRKDKEKKKKHKEKDRDRDKEKEKRRDEKVKQEAKDSRESSPALGLGVKLKIKIGGSTGPSASMMVSGDDKSGSPSPSLPASDVKRESMSPPKVVPKLYISKKGQEEKTKKSVKQANKYKSSPLAVTIRSGSGSPASNAPSPTPASAPLKSPVQTPSRKTPTPPPFAQYADPKPPSPKPKEARDRSVSPAAKEKPKRGRGAHLARKDKDKKKVSKSSVSSGPSKLAKARQISPKRTRQSSSSIEHSSPVSPRQLKSRSPSQDSSHPQSISPPPFHPRRKHNPPSPSPANSKRSSRKRDSPSPGGSPSKPPTPGSTSPNPMLDWSLQESPLHHSPAPTVPNTPTGSPRHSPSHSSLPRTPNPHRSPSPGDSPHVSPVGRTLTPEVSKVKEVPSPASSGKSSAGTKSRTVEAETVCVFIDDTGQKVWICPACKLQDDGSEMIGCDDCDNWYHWPCVGITAAPPEEQSWFCPPCSRKSKASSRGGSRGRGRPRGRGRGRGRKKIT